MRVVWALSWLAVVAGQNTSSPTVGPTFTPTEVPSEAPTSFPTVNPTISAAPSNAPSNAPTSSPTTYSPRRTFVTGPTLSFPNAVKWCTSQGGILPSVHSNADLTFIFNAINLGSSHWIGAQLLTQFGSPSWTDNSPYDYSVINNDNTGTYPSPYYITMSGPTSATMGTANPNAGFPTLCQISADQSLSVCKCFNDATLGHWQSTGYWNPCRSCQPGWSGPNCDVAPPARNPCDPSSCIVGVCNNTIGPDFGKCMCDPGWTGPSCDKCAPGLAGPRCATTCAAGATCNGHGVCNAAADLNVPCGLSEPNGCVGSAGEFCCAYASPGFMDTTLTPAVWVFPGQRGSYRCASSGQSCCGATVCTVDQYCVDPNFGQCCAKQSTACFRKRLNGSAEILAGQGYQCCKVDETCCDGVCCKTSQGRCVERTAPFAEGWYDNQGNAIQPRSVCTVYAKELIGQSGVRAGLLPCLLAISLIAVAIFAVTRGANASKGEVVFALLFIFVAFFQVFSDEWQLGVLYCTWGAVALCLCAGGYHAKLFGFVLMVALAIIVCFAPTFFLLNLWLTGPPRCYKPFGTASATDIATCMANCATYYDAFRIEPTTRPRDADPTPFPPGAGAFLYSDFFGLCSYEAVQFRYYLFALLPALSFLAAAAFGWGLLRTEAPQSDGNGKAFQLCTSCNARMKIDARFCVMCGTPVPAAGATDGGGTGSTDADPKAIELGQMDKQTDTAEQPRTEKGPDGIWREKAVD